MTILILTNNDAGLYRFRKELLVELLKENDVHVSLPNGKMINKLEKLGCIIHKTPISRHGTNPFQDFKLFRLYKKILKSVNPDVVLTYTVKPNVYGGLACSHLKIPYIANITGLGNSIENPGIVQKIVLFLYKKGLKKASTVFFQNKENMEFMIEHKIVRDNSVLLPGSGVNLQENKYEEYPLDDSRLVFVTIGRILKDKGIDELLAAAKTIKKEYNNVVFKVVGSFDGNYEIIINNAVKKGVIEYLGYRDDIHNIIKHSHATIHPSYHEGTSNVLLETAACGRPILASNISGCNNVFDETTGIPFEPKNVESLVLAIKKFIMLPNNERAEMGKKGRKKVEIEFGKSIIINDYIKAINNIKRGLGNEII